ncbi:DUF2577 family protein [Streptobacillus canis]|uniref:DUF2577 family protein n=1 Tax=Streptobacillus canis TaxID=2678686 RepID=UPI0012E1746E|nr:DUF2577 family protein [Streptobacillus canis]
MDNNPFEELAKMFKANENRSYLGTMIAEVIDPLPNLKLKLLNGAMEIDHEIEGDQIFIARSITNRIDIDVTFEKFESQGNIHKIKDGIKLAFKNLKAAAANIVHIAPPSPPNPVVTDLSVPSGNMDEFSSKMATKEKGKFKAQFLVTLKKGDKVLVITNETEDQYFIVDIMDPLKEVELEWEYYQKS